MTDASHTADRRSPRPPARRRRVVILLVLVVIAGTAAIGSNRTAADARAGGRFRGTDTTATPAPPAAVAAPARLRLATFNVHGGRDAGGADAWERAVETLRDFDFIGLQEVRGSPLGPGQAERFGRDLAMPWCFAPTERRYWYGHFGNAALSTLPVRRWESVPLVNTRGKAYRNFLKTEVALGERVLTILVTHIDLREDRIAQLTHVGDVFLALPTPAVLMGDLNSAADDPALRRILDAPGVVDAHAGTLDPTGHIDWILVRGLTVVDAGMIDRGASDHPCYWVEVE